MRHQRLPPLFCYRTSPLCEAPLIPLRVILTHFALSSYKRALRLPTSFPISGLVRLGVKTRLCRSSRIAFVSTHPLIVPPTSHSGISFLALSRFLISPFLQCKDYSFLLVFPLSLFCQDAAFVHLDSLPFHGLLIWTNSCVPFSFGKSGSGVFANCSLCGTEVTLSLLAGIDYSSFSIKAYAILQALCWSRRHQKVCHFSVFLLLSDFHSALSSVFSLTSNSLVDLEKTAFSLFVIRNPGTSFFLGNDAAKELAKWERLLLPSSILVISLLLSCTFCKVICSRLRCQRHNLLLSSYLSRIGRIYDSSCSACVHLSQDISHLILYYEATDFLRCTLFDDSLSLQPLALGTCKASGDPWFSAMLPSLERGRVTTTKLSWLKMFKKIKDKAC